MESNLFEMPWLPDTADELRFRLTLLLAPNYMITNNTTATVDALSDVNRLKAAVDAVISILPKVP